MSSLWSYSLRGTFKRSIGLKPFSIFYYLLSGVLFFVALPFLIYLSFSSKYKESIPSRFFLFRNPKFTQENGVWFHVCSLGEARALKPILDRLQKEKINITTITHTGFAQAKKYTAQVRYLPYELFLPFWVTKQRVVVILEAEFWYMLVLMAKLKGAKVLFLNARISDKSVNKYLKMAWFYRRILENVDLVFAQSQVDKNRFLALGARNIEVVGNIKLALDIQKTNSYTKPEGEVIVAGSTHEGEEKAILEAFVKYKQTQKDAKLFIVPRHPERFESVFTLMLHYATKYDLTLSRFNEQNFATDMVLVDAMGELNNIYAIADIAILGGAFRDDVGGHNPLEPAFFGCKIITGKHFFHQKELFKYVHHVQYVESNEIAKALQNAKQLPNSLMEEKIDLEEIIKTIKEI